MSARDRFRQDTWYDVPTKKGKGNRRQHNEKEKDPGVKFFVSNIPEGCSSSDLVRVLKDFGVIQGTYIARKFDRLGKRFGFVTFNKGRNMDDLESALKDVWIGSYKLFIVPARFVDGKEIPRKEERVWQPVKGKEVQEDGKEEASAKHTTTVDVNAEDSRSFKDTLLNKEPKKNDVPEINVEPSAAVFGEWYDRALVVHLKNLKALTSLRSWMKTICDLNVEIKYVGGLCVILVFVNRDSKMIFTSMKDAWGVHVDLIEEWYGQTFIVPRIAWLKIRGVPLSLSCSKVFDEVASTFGSIIQPAMFPEEDGDLTVACVGVLRAQLERVSQKVKLSWKTSKFDVLVEEKVDDWIPDCLMDLEEEEGIEVEENVLDANPVVDEVFDLNVSQQENQVNSGTEVLVHDGLDSGE
ncbi:putative RNA recognition motif domain, nucleotide-binding alpha-beta plait domain superfamily [Helianthus debilis subsp. tardiflorus]